MPAATPNGAAIRGSFEGRSGCRVARVAIAIVVTELRLRVRDPALPVLLGCIMAACALLTPTAAANYAVITFNGMKPVMSADTSIVAAGAVFGILVFPVNLLFLGAGYSRDRRLGIGRLLASSPVGPATLLVARLLANCVLVTLISFVALALILVTAASRYDAFPRFLSILLYLLIVIPVGLITVTISGLADRYLAANNLVRTALAFVVWFGFLFAFLIGHLDFFGVLYLQHSVLPGQGGIDLSVGIIASQNLPTMPWQTVELSPQFVATRFSLMAASLIVLGIASWVAGSGTMSALSRAARSAPTDCAAATASTLAVAAELQRAAVSHVSALQAAALVLGRCLTRARWTWAAIVLSFLLSWVTARTPRAGLAAALMIPLAVFNGSRMRPDASLRSLELVTPGLWFPSPSLFSAFVLTALSAGPVLPVLVQLPLGRAIHAVLGMLVMVLWLGWTCIGLARPLLGISIYTLVWYLAAFNDIPADVDFLGLAGSTPLSLAIALGLSITFVALVARGDWQGATLRKHTFPS